MSDLPHGTDEGAEFFWRQFWSSDGWAKRRARLRASAAELRAQAAEEKSPVLAAILRRDAKQCELLADLQ